MTNVLSKQNLDSIFHAYDIRGRVDDELEVEVYQAIGAAFVKFTGAKKIVVGFDIRDSSSEYMNAFIYGAIKMGADVDVLGEVPTEMVFFATGKYDEYDGGAVITASHNPQEWNGLKLMRNSAVPLTNDEMNSIKDIILDGLEYSKDEGVVNQRDIFEDYKSTVLKVLEGVNLPDLKLVVDAGNGIGGVIFERVFKDILHDYTPLYFEADGDFPNHPPDPTRLENVQELIEKVQETNADLGIALDGDSDRAAFITKSGKYSLGSFTGAILARHFVHGDEDLVIHDSRIVWPVEEYVQKLGGRTLLSKAGPSNFMGAMRSQNAVFSFEFTSHFYYKDFFYAGSSMLTIAIMLRLIAEGLDLDAEIQKLYSEYAVSGEVNYIVEDSDAILNDVKSKYSDQQIDELDGVSVSSENWRFNIRKSNTQPLVRLNVEGRNKEDVVQVFKEVEKLIGGERQNMPLLEELLG